MNGIYYFIHTITCRERIQSVDLRCHTTIDCIYRLLTKSPDPTDTPTMYTLLKKRQFVSHYKLNNLIFVIII